MNMIIPLIGSAAAAAVAFFTYKAVKENRLLEDQYKQVRDTAAKIPGSSKYPATILVLGFENHGRSSFVNSVFRVLYREEGPLIMRAEAGPLKRTTTSRRLFTVKNKLLRYPKYLLNIIDAPTFSASGDLDQDALRKLLRAENQTSSPKQRNSPAPECVVLIIRSDDAYAQGPAYEKLPEVVQVLREEGLHFVVVLTHKMKVKKVWVSLKNLTRDIAIRTGTDFVQCIENYIARHSIDGRNGANVNNDFYTHIQMLSIIRQCFEYVKQRREAMNTSIHNMHRSKSLTIDELESHSQSLSDDE